MHKSIMAIPVALAVILSPAALRASDITYTVNEVVGTGSVSGFITTDGSTGVLGTSDILDWNLVLNDGTNPTFDLLSTNSQEAVGGLDLTATATQLLFDFSGTDLGYFVFESLTLGDDGPALCYESDIYCIIPSGDSVGLATEYGEFDIPYTPLEGTDVIGSAAVAPTPEPDSLFLLGSGLLGLAGLGRRRFSWGR